LSVQWADDDGDDDGGDSDGKYLNSHSHGIAGAANCVAGCCILLKCLQGVQPANDPLN
jgi:hypothetical protein